MDCAATSAREEVYREKEVAVSRYARLEGGVPLERGFQHPAELSVPRIAYALQAIEVRIPATKNRIPGLDGDPSFVRQAIPNDLLAPIARGLSKGFGEASSSEQLQVVATRKARKLGLFHTRHLTTFVAYLQDDRLVVDLNYSDESLAKDEEDKRPNPEEGKLRTKLTLLRGTSVDVWPGARAAVDYGAAGFGRDEAEVAAGPVDGSDAMASDPALHDALPAATDAPVGSEATLAEGEAAEGEAGAFAATEAATEAGAATANDAAAASSPAELRDRLSESARAELDALETARAHGEVSEGYYRSRRAAILGGAGASPGGD